MAAKIVLTSNTSWSIWNFRRGLVEALRERGYEVYLVAPEDEFSKNLSGFIPLRNLQRKGKNPLQDLKLFLEYLRIYKTLKP
ncbi:MAG: glycosyltransferase family 1 protein, partial [Caldimicrobium sp.]